MERVWERMVSRGAHESSRYPADGRRRVGDALDRSVRDRGPDPRAHAAAAPVEAGRADHAAHDPLYRRRRDGEPTAATAGRVPVGRSTASSSRSSARSTAWARARHCGPWSGRSANWRASIQDQDVKLLVHLSGHRRGDRRADRRQAAAEGRQVRPDRQPRVAAAAASARPTGRPRTPSPT